jgi:hypothetical protein
MFPVENKRINKPSEPVEVEYRSTLHEVAKKKHAFEARSTSGFLSEIFYYAPMGPVATATFSPNGS